MSKKERVSRSYDYQGRLTSETRTSGNESITYHYDPTGQKAVSERNLLRSHRRQEARTQFSILGIVFMLILMASLLRRLSGGSSIPTFTSFLEMLTSVPDISIPFISVNLMQALGDWGVFNFLRDFTNIFIDLLNIIIFLCNGIVQINLYIVYFVRWFFGV